MLAALDTLDPVMIQASIISLMKSLPQLTGAVVSSEGGVEIREDFWIGTKFFYPALRVAVPSVGPHDIDGPCRPFMFHVEFSIYCFAEGSSSKDSAKLAGIVYQNLIGKQLSNSDITPVSVIDCPRDGIIMPVPEMSPGGERLWRSEVLFNTIIKRRGQPS